MANRKPLVITTGQLQRLQSGDTIAAADVENVVTAAANFGAANQLIVSSGTAKAAQSTAILSTNLVTAAAAFATDNTVLRADGTGKGAQTSGVVIDDSAAAIFGSGTNYVCRIGANAGLSATWTGIDNIAIGTDAARAATAERHNVFVGTDAGRSAPGAYEGAIFIGWQPGINAVSVGDYSILIGQGAGNGGTIGADAILVGRGAGFSATVGAGSMFIGLLAGLSANVTTNNLCVGPGAGRSAALGAGNVCFGADAGRGVTGATAGNCCIGNSAGLNAALNSNSNFLMGPNSGSGSTMTASNTLVGNNTLLSGTATSFNVIIGAGAVGAGTTIGSTNVIIGPDAGRSLNSASASDNTFIGSIAGNNGSQLASATNSTAIGNGAFTTASNQVVIGNSSVTQTILRGRVDIGTFLKLPATTELTIASGVVTATQSYHRIDTEANAGTDDLDTINGGVEGMVLVLRAEDSTHTVVVKNGTGNIVCAGDFSLDNAFDRITLLFSGGSWVELCRSDNGA